MGVHEGAAVFLFTHFLKDNPRQDLFLRIESSISQPVSEYTRLQTYCQVVNYLLHAYANDNVISRAHGKVTSLKQLPDQDPVRFKDVLWRQMTRCGCAYSQEFMIHTFIEGCIPRIRSLVRCQYTNDPNVTLTCLAELAREHFISTGGSVTELQDDDHVASRNSNRDNRDGTPDRNRRSRRNRNRQQPPPPVAASTPLYSTETMRGNQEPAPMTAP